MKKLLRFIWVVLLVGLAFALSPQVANASEGGGEDVASEEEVFTFDWDTYTLVIKADIKEPAGKYYYADDFYPWTEHQVHAQKVIFEEGVTTIGSWALHGFTAMKEVVIPESVTTIGHDAFLYCPKLKVLSLPASIRTIGESAFEDCSSLEEIVFPNGLKVIPKKACFQCAGLTRVVIPETVKKIGAYAFESCRVLQEIKFPKGIQKLPVRVCYECWELKRVTIPDGVTAIGAWAFKDTSLTSVTLPDGVEEIGKEAFPNNPEEEFFLHASCSNKVARAYAKKYNYTFVSTGKHIWGQKVTKATPEKDGRIDSKCKVCGAEGKTTVIPKASRISLSETSFVYNGKVQRPEVLVRNRKGKALAASRYTLAWSKEDSKVPGTYTVTVKLAGNYSGSVKLSYTITPAKVLKLRAKKTTAASVRLVWEKAPGAEVYKVQAAAEGEDWKTVGWTSANALLVKGLKAGTRYRFRVRAFDKARTNGGPYSAVCRRYTRCAAPKVTAVSEAPKEGKVSWKKVAGAVRYDVYTSLDNATWELAVTTEKRAVTLDKLRSGQTLYVKVCAQNPEGLDGEYGTAAAFVK